MVYRVDMVYRLLATYDSQPSIFYIEVTDMALFSPRHRKHPPGGIFSPDTLYFVILGALLLVLLAAGIRINAYWRELAGSMALSDASDLITMTVNETVRKKLSEGNYPYDAFIRLEKDDNGAVTAITTNMSEVNGFSTEVLYDVVNAAEGGLLDIRIPIGTLLGSSLTMGRGPSIPVEVMALTSSRADFRNELSSAGINQTKHQIILELIIDIDVIVPWDTLSTQVVCQTLIAETVIVGKVPETYFS